MNALLGVKMFPNALVRKRRCVCTSVANLRPASRLSSTIQLLKKKRFGWKLYSASAINTNMAHCFSFTAIILNSGQLLKKVVYFSQITPLQ